MTALLELRGLTKAYPGVVANDDVSFAIERGEVHALLGENGAGKSTLVKTIYGLVRPDAGSMRLGGVDFAPPEPRAARAAGIGMVFQHFSLFDALTVAENVTLGMEHPPPLRTLAAEIASVSRDYGLPLDPARRVGDLSAGERQRVEIVRCLLQRPSLLIMDEPTSVLTPQEVAILFRTLRQLSGEGVAILYISHKLEEIRALCDTATILRRGKVVGRCTPRDRSAAEMAETMVGAVLTPPARGARRDWGPGPPPLEVRGLTAASPGPFGTALRGITFAVARGEVLGIAGVAGNGQEELLLALSGEMRCAPDMVRSFGSPVGDLDPAARRALGFVAAPEDRLGHAAAPDMSLVENALLSGAVAKRLTRHGFVDWARTRSWTSEIVAAYDVRTPGTDVAARSLSGGNLQKFLIGRELSQAPKVVVIDQPTWGVDAAAAAFIRQEIMDRAAEGAAVVVISQDLDDLLQVSDRFAALNEGRLSETCPTAGLTVDRIGLMMGGAHGMEVAHHGG